MPLRAPLLALSFLISGSAHAACDAPTSARDLADASGQFYAAWDQLDGDGVASALAEAEHALLCTDQPLTAPDVVTLFQLTGLAAFLEDDTTRARDAFRTAVAVLPNYSLPSTVAAPGDDWYEMYEALRSLPDDGRTPLPDPTVGWVQVDGARATEHPSGRPWVFQQFDDRGGVVQTAVVWTRQTPPTYAAVEPSPEEPPPTLASASDRHPSRGLLIGGVVAGVAGVAGLGGAAATKAQYEALQDPMRADRLIGPNIALGSLGWAGALTGASLATSAVVVGRW